MSKEKVLNEWVQNYTKDLLNWCNYKINDLSQAEDLVQETFISAFENYDNFKGNSSERTWLYKILNNKIIDYYRRKGKLEFVRNSIDLNDAEKMTDSFFDDKGAWNKEFFDNSWGRSENLLDDKEFRDILLLCIDDLPENWKNAILSKYIQNKKTKDVCQELKITSSNYWQILHRSKMLLKLCLENNWFKK